MDELEKSAYDFMNQPQTDELEEFPELKCNHCGVVFKGNHECNYEKLKEINKELKSLCLWSARRLNGQLYKDFAYDEYEKITGEKPERL